MRWLEDEDLSRPPPRRPSKRPSFLPSRNTLIGGLSGTYESNCAGRSGSWSIPAGDSTTPLRYSPLGGITNDVDCELTLTNLVASSGPDDAMLVNPHFDPPIALSDSWASSGPSQAARRRPTG